MFKKAFFVLIILAMLVVVAANIFARKAPDLLREALEKALDKKVTIGSIEYHFPATFDLERFELQEKDAPFAGETLFAVDHVTLSASPWGLSKRSLDLDRIQVENATIVIRKLHGKLYPVFSRNAGKGSPPGSETPSAETRAGGPPNRPLSIDNFLLKDSHFKFIDYDADVNGFVVTLDNIQASVRDIRLPLSAVKTSYALDAVLTQERDQPAAPFRASGWTRFASLDTEASFDIGKLHIPFFRPYYAKVTPAAIEDGTLDFRMRLGIKNKDLTADLDVTLFGLLFGAYETGDELFGFNAGEILSLLKDPAGRIRLQFPVRWNLADRSVKFSGVVRRSIEQSLKKAALGNVGGLLEKTLFKIGEKGLDAPKDSTQGVLKKIKDFFKY